MDLDHIRSGRFIHDELLIRAAQAVAKIPDLWREHKSIYPTMLLWPEDDVKTTTSRRFSGVVFAELPDLQADRMPFIERAVRSCDAYAVLVTEQLDGAVRSIFESKHGTETWRLPLKDYGGAMVLGAAARRTNTESVGVLWHAN